MKRVWPDGWTLHHVHHRGDDPGDRRRPDSTSVASRGGDHAIARIRGTW
jgi:hypothetical protein